MASAFSMDNLSFLAKYGLHDSALGVLPTEQAYQQAQSELLTGFNPKIQIDIKEALSTLESTSDGKLHIKVPTLGFSDPSLDYDARPWFATIFQVNGFMADEADPSLSRAESIVVTDIMGNQYPLQFTDTGKIDYAAIKANLNPGNTVFSTISELTFIYSKNQILDGMGLKGEPTGELLLMAPLHILKPFSVSISVEADGFSAFQDTYEWMPVLNGPMLALDTVAVDWQGDHISGELSIDISATPLIGQVDRFSVSLELPEIEGLSYKPLAQSAANGLSGNTLNLSLDQGLSQVALKTVVEQLFSKEAFEKSLMNKAAQPEDNGSKGEFNAYSKVPNSIETLFEVMSQGVVEQSVPIMALSEYFYADEQIIANLKALDIGQFDGHDQVVLNNWMESYLMVGADAFIDNIDKAISQETHLIDIGVNIATEGAVFDTEAMIQVDITNLEIAEMQFPDISIMAQQNDAFIIHNVESLSDSNPFGDTMFDDMPQLGENWQPEQSTGQTFIVSSESILDSADVINGFDIRANDKIDLSALLETLGDNLSPSDVQLQTTDEGDTQVLIGNPEGSESAEPIHVVTIVGLSEQDLPSDPSSFIEL